MAHQEADKAFRAWQDSEEAYAKAVAPFLKSSHGDGKITKKSAIRLSELRGKADDRLRKYLDRALR